MRLPLLEKGSWVYEEAVAVGFQAGVRCDEESTLVGDKRQKRRFELTPPPYEVAPP